jgi:hypothetical protein
MEGQIISDKLIHTMVNQIIIPCLHVGKDVLKCRQTHTAKWQKNYKKKCL